MSISSEAKVKLARLQSEAAAANSSPLLNAVKSYLPGGKKCPTCGQSVPEPMSESAQALKNRQEAEQIPEGNVQRGPR